MNEEEIKEYLKRTDKLLDKLSGEDKDTLEWLIFGYNQCAKMLYEKENIIKGVREYVDKQDNMNYKFREDLREITSKGE